MFANTIHKINEQSTVLDHTLEDDEKIHEKELNDALLSFVEDASIHTLHVHNNFEFGWLLGPRGFAAESTTNDAFSACICRSDKFRIIASAKLKDFPESFDWGELHEFKMRNCFPLQSSMPPTIVSKGSDAWAPALENRGCSIGITYIENEQKDKNKMTRDYYITVHTCLNYGYLSETIHEDFKIDRDNRHILTHQRTEDGRLSNDKQLVTYEDVFKDSYNVSALDIARENACRLIVIYAEMYNLELLSGISETRNKYVYEPKDILHNLEKMMEMSIKILAKWPSNVPIYPFTVITPSQTLLPAAEFKEKQDFPFGYCLQELKKQNEVKFEDIRKTHKINFIDAVKTCHPDIMNDYNTFRMDYAGKMVWYSNCVCTDGPVMVYEGPALGYMCFNYHDDNTTNREWQNNAGSSFPVLFPSQKNHNKEYEMEVYAKCFSVKKGGVKHRNAIEQLHRVFTNLASLDSSETSLSLNIAAVNKMRMHCKKIFFSTDGFEMSRFHTEEE
jgi:hypothetical protein